MTEHRSAYGDPLNLSRKLPPHPSDRRCGLGLVPIWFSLALILVAICFWVLP